MDPIDWFERVWSRCDHLSDLHAYLDGQNPGALRPEELLRAELAARVAALDLYVHEIVAQEMVAIFEGRRSSCSGYLRFDISNSTLSRIVAATPGANVDAVLAFDLDVRGRLEHRSLQKPDKIADAFRLISDVTLWSSVADQLGVNVEVIKTELSLIVDRRNGIVHSGDMLPGNSGEATAISAADVRKVAHTIERVVRAIDTVARLDDLS